MKFVVVFGNLQYGIQTIHGPFNNKEDAAHWAVRHESNQPYAIIILKDF